MWRAWAERGVMAGRFKIGDLVRHQKSETLVFLVEFELLSGHDAGAASLYRCSETTLIGYERHTYHEDDLLPAGDVKPIERPGAFKRSTSVLYDMLVMAKHGGMREKRAAELYDELVDHWNALDEEKDRSEAMGAMVSRIRQLAAVAEKESG